MTEKQKRFADEYLIDCNATRAYKAAYPSVKKDTVAGSNGMRLLKNAEIKKYIDEQLEKLHDEKTADAKEVMEYLTAVLRGETQSEIVVIEGEGDGVSVARTMNKAPDEREKLKAAELLGKRFGLFKDNVNVSGSAAVQIIDDIGGKDG
ncbi:MAG: terminase small subunit [Candidatus Ornithomonoglobus sp.]